MIPKNIQVGNKVKDSSGEIYEVVAVYNEGTAAHQVLLSKEHYPILVSEMNKLGYHVTG